MTSVQALTVVLPACYLATAVMYAMAFAGERAPRFATTARRALLTLTLMLHATLFALHGAASGSFPVQGPWPTVSAVALLTAALFLAVSVRTPQPTVGSLLLGLVFVLQLVASSALPMQAGGGLLVIDSIGVLHVLLMVVASASVLLSGCYGALHLVLYRQMQRRAFGPVFRQLPDLETLGRMTRRAALTGFLGLTIGLNMGIGLAHAREVERFHYTDPQVLLVMALWIHFGLIAFSHRIPVLSARRASHAAVWGLVTLLAALALMLVPGFSFHSVR